MTDMKPVKAWAVVTSRNCLFPWGNGQEWQYPLFATKRRPAGANSFLERKNVTKDCKTIAVYIVPAEQWERLNERNPE